MSAAPESRMTTGRFVAELIVQVPEASEVVGGHLDDYGQEILLHLLMADLLRFAVRTYHEQRRDVTARLLDFVDGALRNGDAAVDNAVALSFVEHIGGFPEETPEFIAFWPAGLLAERDRQLSWQPPSRAEIDATHSRWLAMVGNVVWLTAEQGGRRSGPPAPAKGVRYRSTAFVVPHSVDDGLAGFVTEVEDPSGYSSPARGDWLLPAELDHRHDVAPGSVLVLTEGRRRVAYFHVDGVYRLPAR